MLVPTTHPLYKLNSKKRLALLLDTHPFILKNIESSLEVFPFTKKVGNKYRNLFNVDAEYKRILRKLNQLLLKVNIPEYIYAGVPNKDFLKNAVWHHQNKYIHNADIKSFFPSTQDNYVYGFFLHKFQMSADIAKILTILTTYPSKEGNHRHLPQGFPTSTILSSLAYFDLFHGIQTKCHRNNIQFTLFVDDMTFSSNTRIPKSFLKHVSHIVKEHSLQLHEKKIYRNGPYHFPNVTGVIVYPGKNTFKAPNKLQRKMYYNFKAVHQAKISTFTDYIEFKQKVLSLEGQLNAVKRIENNRHTPYIDKKLKGIKNNFIHSTVKGASRESLYQEFKLFRNS